MKIVTWGLIALGAMIALSCDGDGVNGITIRRASSITVEPTRLNLRTGETVQLTVTLLDSKDDPIEDPALTFTSSDDAVATVSGNGVITGIGEGTGVVTVEAESLRATLLVTVQAIVGSVKIDPEALTEMRVNDVRFLTATVLDHSGEEIPGAVVEWSSDNDGVATVEAMRGGFNWCDCDAIVTAASRGEATIAAESRGVTAKVIVTIDKAGLVFDSLELKPAEATIPVGGSVQLTVTILDTDGKRSLFEGFTEWWTEHSDVATVDANGLVTCIAKGTTTIHAGLPGPWGPDPSDSAVITVE